MVWSKPLRVPYHSSREQREGTALSLTTIFRPSLVTMETVSEREEGRSRHELIERRGERRM
jgi:hypothetical protein